MKKIMMITSIIASGFLLSGCTINGITSISNDEIIKETKKCEEAGMTPYQIVNTWDYSVTRVICTNKENK